MINLLGKGLALLQVGLSVMLMGFALALYFNAVDFGWEQPARYWHEAKGKKGDNLLVPSAFDKREAAMRKLLRIKRDELARLGTLQDNYAGLAMILGTNHLQGKQQLEQLENGEGKEIKGFTFSETGALVLSPAEFGMPVLGKPVPGVSLSYAGYLAKLKDVDARIEAIQANMDELLKKEAVVTARLSGKMNKDGKQTVDRSGNVIEPGLHYLLESQFQTQRELLKEIEYVQPLWVKELVDSQLVLNRRDNLLRRLEELGDKRYLSQSEFLKKLP